MSNPFFQPSLRNFAQAEPVVVQREKILTNAVSCQAFVMVVNVSTPTDLSAANVLWALYWTAPALNALV